MNIKFYLCWGLTLLRIFSDSSAINVALKKTGLYCARVDVSGKVFDGDANYGNSMSLHHHECEKAILRVNLGRPYSIQYVVVYVGEKHNDVLDLFSAELMEGSANKLCGNFPFKTKPLGKPMRINCYDRNRLYPAVEIRALKAGPLDIAEFEVHSFALESETYVLLYRGCYSAIDSSSWKESWEKCQKKCFDTDYVFVAIKGNNMCGCTNTLTEANVLDDDKCGIVCEGRQRYCGGEDAFSVYIVKPPLPHFVACYQRPDAFTSASIKDMTYATCLRLCSTSPYFALTKQAKEDVCDCRNNKPSDSEGRNYPEYCNESCKGEPEHFCGGKHGYTVARSCMRDNGLGCLDIMMCEGESDMFGVCVKGCKEGYVGEHCMQKDFTIPETFFDMFEGSGFQLNKNTLMVLGLSLLLLSCLGMLMCGGDSDYDSSSSS